MKRSLLILVSLTLLFLLVVGGMWFWRSREARQSYSNPALNPVPSPAPTTETTPPAENATPSETPTAPTPSAPTPPKGVSLDSSSQSGATVTSPSVSQPSTAAQSASQLDITPHLVSFGFSQGSASRAIDTIVVHSSYNALGGDEFSNDGIWKEWKEAGVSPHYYIDRAGIIYQFVKEGDIAWHAGTSTMPDGRTDVNNFSLGIEMDGTKTSGYTDAEYQSLNALIADIKTRHTIKYIVGHADIAPGRKTDPWVFDWSKVKK